MIVSAWKGGTYGIRVGRANAFRYFPKTWKQIEVEVDNDFYTFTLSSTFWTTCPEFRGGPIPEWLLKQNLKDWPKGNPPKFELIPLEGNRFRLSSLKDDIYRSNKKHIELI